MSNELENYIIQSALKYEIDPQVALRVARGEGGLQNPFRHGEGPAPRSQDPALGHLENSYGPFQLYVSGTGAGLGDRALAAGIDPSKNWQGGVDFALNEASKKGWGQWYGAKAAGITGMMGINGAPAGAVPAGSVNPSVVGNPASPVPTPFGDVVAPPSVVPAAAPPGIGDAIATFLASRQDRDKAAAADKARRQALFGGGSGLASLYG